MSEQDKVLVIFDNPLECGDCPCSELCIGENPWCSLQNKEVESYRIKPSWCPLKRITEDAEQWISYLYTTTDGR